MHQYAQTNLQLFNQLRREGYSNIELGCIFNAYKLVTSLYTGCFRPSGKTFIAHLVGTASILSFLRAPANVVAAGLLHAAYSSGDFKGSGKRGISKVKREHLIRAIGYEVEEYIARFTELQWNEQTIPAIYERLDALDPIDRDVLLIRLANELEEYLDLSILYCANVKQQEYAKHNEHLVVGMAEKLGFPALAVELTKVFKETASSEIPIELRYRCNQNFPFFIAPKRKNRPSLAPYRATIRKLRHLRSALIMRITPHFGRQS